MKVTKHNNYSKNKRKNQQLLNKYYNEIYVYKKIKALYTVTLTNIIIVSYVKIYHIKCVYYAIMHVYTIIIHINKYVPTISIEYS